MLIYVVEVGGKKYDADEILTGYGTVVCSEMNSWKKKRQHLDPWRWIRIVNNTAFEVLKFLSKEKEKVSL